LLPPISGGLEYLFDKQKVLTIEFSEEEVTIKQVSSRHIHVLPTFVSLLARPILARLCVCRISDRCFCIAFFFIRISARRQLAQILAHMKTELLRERPELFMQGETVYVEFAKCLV
jgi:hypothetical protein